MSQTIQIARTPTPGRTPAIGTLEEGELWINLADETLGYIDGGQVPRALLPIRHFSPVSNYYDGQFIWLNGDLYRALGDTGPGPFDTPMWTRLAYLDELGGGAFIGDAPPTAPTPGSLWFNSDDGQLYVYYRDQNSSQWVIAINPGSGAPLSATQQLSRTVAQLTDTVATLVTRIETLENRRNGGRKS